MEWFKFWQRGRKDRELAQELAEYVDHETDDNVAAGMSPRDARHAALRKLGNATLVREAVYERHSIPVVDDLLRDVRYALGQLRRAPAFAVAAILSLAFGIGANTAIFQLLDALTLKTLPVADPAALVEVRLTGQGRFGRQTGRNRQLSYPQWRELERRQEAFASMLAFGDTRFNLAPQGEVRYVEGLRVSGTYFDTLGIQPLAGRLFSPADDRWGCGYAGAVVSSAFWQRELGGRADVVGQTLDVDTHRVPIIGVTPARFFGLEVGRSFDVALPMCAADWDSAQHWWLAAVGRLKPHWTIDQAQSHLLGLIAGIQRDTLTPTHPAAYVDGYLAMQVELHDASTGLSPLRRSYQEPLRVLLAIAALVLLIAAMNLASLMLARASARAQEFAIRLAIGGSRRRILQQVLTESLLIAALGGAAALGVAWLASQSIVSLFSTPTDRIFLDLTFDWRVFGFTAAIATAAALIFGIAPALRAVRSITLSTGERAATGTRESLALRRGLVAVQVAVTLVLLFGALLFLRSFRNLTTTETGMREDVLIANLFLRADDYPEVRRPTAYRAIDDRLRALPGVTGVANASSPPLSGAFWDTDIKIDGEIKGRANVNQVSQGYFAVMGTPMVAGRDFDERDTPSSPRVAIVTETFAKTFLGGAPLGKTVTMPGTMGGGDALLTVVGVVKDQKYYTLREDFTSLLFLAWSQERQPGLTHRVVLHALTPPAALVPSVKAALAEIDPAISVRFATLQRLYNESLLRDRLMMRLSSLFGVVALTLAIVGLYGVVAYMVASRRAEIGVRVALGAGRARILAIDARRHRPDDRSGHDRRVGRRVCGRRRRWHLAVRSRATRRHDTGDGDRALVHGRACGRDPAGTSRDQN